MDACVETESNVKANDRGAISTRACASCQKAHSRCDGKQPCSSCARRGISTQCIYLHAKRRGPKAKMSAYENVLSFDAQLTAQQTSALPKSLLVAPASPFTSASLSLPSSSSSTPTSPISLPFFAFVSSSPPSFATCLQESPIFADEQQPVQKRRKQNDTDFTPEFSSLSAPSLTEQSPPLPFVNQSSSFSPSQSSLSSLLSPDSSSFSVNEGHDNQNTSLFPTEPLSEDYGSAFLELEPLPASSFSSSSSDSPPSPTLDTFAGLYSPSLTQTIVSVPDRYRLLLSRFSVVVKPPLPQIDVTFALRFAVHWENFEGFTITKYKEGKYRVEDLAAAFEFSTLMGLATRLQAPDLGVVFSKKTEMLFHILFMYEGAQTKPHLAQRLMFHLIVLFSYLYSHSTGNLNRMRAVLWMAYAVYKENKEHINQALRCRLFCLLSAVCENPRQKMKYIKKAGVSPHTLTPAISATIILVNTYLTHPHLWPDSTSVISGSATPASTSMYMRESDSKYMRESDSKYMREYFETLLHQVQNELPQEMPHTIFREEVEHIQPGAIAFLYHLLGYKEKARSFAQKAVEQVFQSHLLSFGFALFAITSLKILCTPPEESIYQGCLEKIAGIAIMFSLATQISLFLPETMRENFLNSLDRHKAERVDYRQVIVSVMDAYAPTFSNHSPVSDLSPPSPDH